MMTMWQRISGNHINRYNHPLSNGDPDYVIMDVSWLDYHWPNFDIFKKFPLRELLQLVTSISMECDYDPIVWEAIGNLLDENEEKAFDFSSTSIIIERIIEMFYEELNCLTKTSNSGYLFHDWADYNALILKRER